MKLKINFYNFIIIFSILISAILITDIFAYLNGLYKIKNLYLFKKYLNPATERNIPTLLSALSFLLIGLLSNIYAKKTDKKFFKFYLFLFSYLALDDLLMIHEQIGSFIGELFLKNRVVGYYWQYIYDPFLIFFLGLFYIFVSYESLKNKKIKAFIILNLGYLLYGISQSMDFFEGLRPSLESLTKYTNLSHKQLIHILRDIEETLEIYANLFIALSLAIFLKIKEISIQFNINFK